MQRNQTLANFCSYWKGRTPRLAVRNALSNAFPDLFTLLLPIDVHGLAKRRGIREIIYADLRTDGQISLSPEGSYVVYLNKSQTDSRQRFTLAHEIAHTLFFEALGHKTADLANRGVSCLRDRDEEKLCDFAASEILMPKAQLDFLTKRYGFTARGIVNAAQECRTSLQSMAKRIIDLTSVKLAACLWEKDDRAGAFVAQWVEGLTAPRSNDLPLAISANQPAFKAFNSNAHFRGRYWISLGGPVDHYFIDAHFLAGRTVRVLTTVALDAEAAVLFRTLVGEAQEARQPSLF